MSWISRGLIHCSGIITVAINRVLDVSRRSLSGQTGDRASFKTSVRACMCFRVSFVSPTFCMDILFHSCDDKTDRIVVRVSQRNPWDDRVLPDITLATR